MWKGYITYVDAWSAWFTVYVTADNLEQLYAVIGQYPSAVSIAVSKEN